jgi:hypothetical protein
MDDELYNEYSIINKMTEIPIDQIRNNLDLVKQILLERIVEIRDVFIQLKKENIETLMYKDNKKMNIDEIIQMYSDWIIELS